MPKSTGARGRAIIGIRRRALAFTGLLLACASSLSADEERARGREVAAPSAPAPPRVGPPPSTAPRSGPALAEPSPDHVGSPPPGDDPSPDHAGPQSPGDDPSPHYDGPQSPGDDPSRTPLDPEPLDLDPSDDAAESVESAARSEGWSGPGRAALAPELQPLPDPRWIRHRRAPRESLVQIAYRYGVELSRLREWNDLAPGQAPPPRKKFFRVRARRTPPSRERVQYTVKPGDTWWTIAMRHGVDSRDLRAYNWPRKGKMQPGASLKIWIDPVVFAWVDQGPDPVALDRDQRSRRGAIGIGPPADGILRNGLRIPPTDGIHLRLPKSAYGTSHAVDQLVAAIERFHARSDYPLPVELGSMSLPRGGPIGSHKSHQSGRDVDVRLLRRPEVSTWKPSKGSRVQWSAVWELVLALAEADVMVIFLDYPAQRRLYRAAKARGASVEQLASMLQYPRGAGASRGLVRHSPGHDTHLHVRFGCGPFETECVP